MVSPHPPLFSKFQGKLRNFTANTPSIFFVQKEKLNVEDLALNLRYRQTRIIYSCTQAHTTQTQPHGHKRTEKKTKNHTLRAHNTHTHTHTSRHVQADTNIHI